MAKATRTAGTLLVLAVQIIAGVGLAAVLVSRFTVEGGWPALLATCGILLALWAALAAIACAVWGKHSDSVRSFTFAVREGSILWPVRPRVFITVWLTLPVLTPLLLWTAVRIAAALDLQVRLSGFWPVVVATLVALIGRWLLRLLIPGEPGLFPGERRAVLSSTALCMAVLWLADLVFDGVALAPGPEWQRWLTNLVLAALFVLLACRWQLSGPGMSVALAGIGWLLLWLITWLSTWLDVTLSMSGVFAFGLTAAALTVVVWPVRIVRAAAELPHDSVHV
jgi:hypothetical protein